MQTGGSRPRTPRGYLAGRRLYTRPVPPEPHSLPDREQQEAEVRPLPVLAEPRPVERRREASLPAAVVAATGGFLIGVATFVLVRLLRRPRTAASLRLGRGRRRGKRVEIATSRSFLVDVHLLKDR
jgi:hypothetical protein